MRILRVLLIPLTALIICLGLLGGCGGGTSATPAPAASAVPAAAATTASGTSSVPITGAGAATPITPEQSPAGDIPDNQVFVPYTSPADGYTVQVPQGWARAATPSGVTFTDKFNGVGVDAATAPAAPTVASVQAAVVPALAQNGKAVTVTKVEQVSVPAGQAVRITDTANSDPNPVTGKRVRLEEERYLFFKNGKQVTLILWAPEGSDNVDAWKQIADSFRWSA